MSNLNLSDPWEGRLRKRRADGTVAPPPPKKLCTNTAVAVESWATRLRPRKRSAPIISPMPAPKSKKAKPVAAKQVRAPSTIRPSATRAVARQARRAARLMAAKRVLLWARMRSLLLLFGRRSAFSALLFRYKGILAERERQRRLLAVRALAQRLFRALVKRNAIRQRIRRVFRALVWRRFTLRARMRRLLIKLARRVRGDRGKLVYPWRCSPSFSCCRATLESSSLNFHPPTAAKRGFKTLRADTTNNSLILCSSYQSWPCLGLRRTWFTGTTSTLTCSTIP